MQKFKYFEVECLAPPEKPFVVTKEAGKLVTDSKVTTWTDLLEQKGEEGWELASCSVFAGDGIIPLNLGWLRLYAVFKQPISSDNRHST